MTRKDIEKDSERPHYYSQFWLDIAAGRRVIGAPRPNEEGELAEPEMSSEPAPAPHRKATRTNSESEARIASDGYAERIAYPVAAPLAGNDEFSEPTTEDVDPLANEEIEPEYQDTPVEDADIPDMDLTPVEAEDEEEELFEDEVEEEEEEDEDGANWGRGRKKAKPTRPVKPVVKKPGKRDTRRSF